MMARTFDSALTGPQSWPQHSFAHCRIQHNNIVGFLSGCDLDVDVLPKSPSFNI